MQLWSMPATQQGQNGAEVRLWLWVVIALFTAATLLPLFPEVVPPRFIVACHIVPTALFALIHGARIYRIRGIVTFALFSIIIGNLFETVGVLTGFPFGQYSFTERMGPKLLQVPILNGTSVLRNGLSLMDHCYIDSGQTGCDLQMAARSAPFGCGLRDGGMGPFH